MSLELDKSRWQRVKFGDVVRNVNLTTKDAGSLGIDRVVAMKHMDPGDLKISRWGDVADGTTFTRVVRPGQTLFGKRRAYQRKVAYAEFDAVCSGDIYTFEAIEGRFLPQLLPFLVLSEGFFEHALGTSAGSLSPRTNWSDLADFEFDLPSPQEQSLLAELLWSVERYRAALSALDVSIGHAASRWVRTLRESAPSTKRVSDVATIRNGQNYPVVMQDGREGDIPFFKVADLDRPGNARFLTNPTGWITVDDAALLGAEVLPPGTIVTARVGAAIRLERRRALQMPGLVDENHLVIRPFAADSGFLLAMLAETQLARTGNDGVVPSLNQKIVGSVLIPSLSPEREAFVGDRYVELGDAREAAATERSALHLFRATLLNEIFGGN